MRFIIVLLSLTLLVSPVQAQDRASGIRDVISGQIEAFLADDFVGAFEFASPNIRRIFRTPDNFGNMVRNGYPMVWRPGDVQFLELEDESGRLVQNVLVRDPSGRYWALEYDMVMLESGWKINGVRVLPAPGAGV